jgi:hypothetical protein
VTVSDKIVRRGENQTRRDMDGANAAAAVHNRIAQHSSFAVDWSRDAALV